MKKILTFPLVFMMAMVSGRAADTGATVQGKILNPDGTPTRNALVLAEPGIKQSQTKRSIAHSEADGTFSFSGLPAGHYRICVQAADRTLLNPCRWSATPPSVDLAAMKTPAPLTIILQKGRRVELDLTFDGTEGSQGRTLLLGVWRANGLFMPLPRHTKGAREGKYEIYVPSNEDLQLSLHSSSYAISTSPDSKAKIDGSNTVIPLPAGSADVQHAVHLEAKADTSSSK